jgi:hypothetical protein
LANHRRQQFLHIGAWQAGPVVDAKVMGGP